MSEGVVSTIWIMVGVALAIEPLWELWNMRQRKKRAPRQGAKP
jgi:hypothetical protein